MVQFTDYVKLYLVLHTLAFMARLDCAVVFSITASQEQSY